MFQIFGNLDLFIRERTHFTLRRVTRTKQIISKRNGGGEKEEQAFPPREAAVQNSENRGKRIENKLSKENSDKRKM